MLGVDLLLTEFSNIGIPDSNKKVVAPNDAETFVGYMGCFYERLFEEIK